MRLKRDHWSPVVVTTSIKKQAIKVPNWFCIYLLKLNQTFIEIGTPQTGHFINRDYQQDEESRNDNQEKLNQDLGVPGRNRNFIYYVLTLPLFFLYFVGLDVDAQSMSKK